jgi:NAD(P)-dependent dehydrogenase (short-subunit alcohol dehydrogenase family)
VTAAGRHAEELADVYDHDPGVGAESVDLTDDDSIAGLARRVGTVDHVVSTASARARGMIGDLERDAVRRSFDTKVIGPLMLARAFRGQINDGGVDRHLLGSCGVRHRARHARGRDHQRRGGHPHPVAGRRARTDPRQCDLPGVIDTGAWDALGEDGKAKLFAEKRERNPARRIGAPEDIGDAAILAMTNTFMTGLTLHVDGGEHLT